jgi:hypothetical protein
MPNITGCPLCGLCYEESSREEADNPNRMCTSCWRSRSHTGTTHKVPPSPLELMERGFVHPNTRVVLHDVLVALYANGPNTE